MFFFLSTLHCGDLVQSIVLIFTHRFILSHVIDDHDLLIGALKRFVPLSAALVTLQKSCAGRRSLRRLGGGRYFLERLRRLRCRSRDSWRTSSVRLRKSL